MTAGSVVLVTPSCFCEWKATRFNATYIWTDYFLSINASVVLTEEYNVMVKVKNSYLRIYETTDEVSHKPMSP